MDYDSLKGVESLINAPHDKEFVFHDGTRAKNLLDVFSKLETMPDHAFHHFVNNHKNDFATWTEHVLSDKHFAQILRTTTSRLETIQMIKDKINDVSLGSSIGMSLIKVPKLEDHTPNHHPSENHDKKESKEVVKEQLKEDSTDNSTEKTVESHKEKSGHKWLKLFSKRHKDEKKLEALASREEKVVAKEEKKTVKEEKQDSKEQKAIAKEEKKAIKEEKLIVKEDKAVIKEEKKHHADKELPEEIVGDDKENTLWVILYFALILLIITLLVYKLFL